jgi:hypothetical protein
MNAAPWRRGMTKKTPSPGSRSVDSNFGQNRKLQQSKCDAFNAAHPVGSAVDLLKDNGETLRTVTRSIAQVLEGHTPVIWVRGVAGCYLLDRVTPVMQGDQT